MKETFKVGCSSRTNEGKKMKPSRIGKQCSCGTREGKRKTFRIRMEGTLQCRRKPSR